jgi:hypothetical protein
MNLALIDPFQLAQDHPDTLTHVLSTFSASETRSYIAEKGSESGHAVTLRFSRKGDYLASGRVNWYCR